MLKFVHHVHYVVRNRDDMVAYLEKNFGMQPEGLDESEPRGSKDALYRAGQTLIEITEPTKPGSTFSDFLEKNGPGIFHIAWGVDDIAQVAQGLIAKGHTLRGGGGVTQSGRGYNLANIDPKESLGVWFQLAEDPS